MANYELQNTNIGVPPRTAEIELCNQARGPSTLHTNHIDFLECIPGHTLGRHVVGMPDGTIILDFEPKKGHSKGGSEV